MLYLRKPEQIDAIQWTGDNHDDITTFLARYETAPRFTATEDGWNDEYNHDGIDANMVLFDFNGHDMEADPGDWIIIRNRHDADVLPDNIFTDEYQAATIGRDMFRQGRKEPRNIYHHPFPDHPGDYVAVAFNPDTAVRIITALNAQETS